MTKSRNIEDGQIHFEQFNSNVFYTHVNVFVAVINDHVPAFTVLSK